MMVILISGGLLMLPIIVVAVICGCVSHYNKKHEFVLPLEANNEIVRNAQEKCRTWFNMSILWLSIEYLGVILPFECTAIILYLDVYEQNSIGIFAFSIISMLLIILTYVIRPHSHAIAYRKAFVVLNRAIYASITKSFDLTGIQKALYSGEMQINGAFDIDDETPDNKI